MVWVKVRFSIRVVYSFAGYAIDVLLADDQHDNSTKTTTIIIIITRQFVDLPMVCLGELVHILYQGQGRIQEFAKGGPVPPVPFLSPLLSPLSIHSPP